MSHPAAHEHRTIDLRDDVSTINRTQVIDPAEYRLDDAWPDAPQAVGATPAATATPDVYDWSRDGVRLRPRRGFGGPLGAGVALLASAGLVALAASVRPSSSASGTTLWTVLRASLNPASNRSIPAWWGIVLFTLAAVWCWTAAGRARAGRRWLRLALWGLLGLVVVLAALSELLALRVQIPAVDTFSRWGLPQYLVQRPVDAVVLVALAVPVLLLLPVGGETQRILLVLGVALYAVGTLVVAGGSWRIPGRPLNQELVQMSFEWLGVLCLMAAAGLEQVRPRRRRG